MKKGTGFDHGNFYSLFSILDGCSRHIVNSDVRDSMTEGTSAIGRVTPKDMLAGRQQDIQTERERKLETPWKQRQIVASRPLKNERPVSRQPESRMKWITSGWPIRTRSCGHFFSNSFQFVITVIGSDAASVSTELMMNFWPFGIAAQR